MKRISMYVLALVLLVALGLTGCQKKLENGVTSVKMPLKNIAFTVSKKDSEGNLKKVGSAIYNMTTEVYQANGKQAYKIDAVITDSGNTTSVTSYLANDAKDGFLMMPYYSEKSYAPAKTNNAAGWKVTATYDNAKKNCAMMAVFTENGMNRSESANVALTKTYLDNDTLPLTIRSLPLTDNYGALINVVVPQYSRSQSIRVEVDGTTDITVPLGKFECYKVLLKANSDLVGDATATVVYISKKDNKVVRIEQGGYIFQLTQG